MSQRLLFLDRDGTLNRSLGSRPPNRPDEVELYPGVTETLSTWVEQGWTLIIVTNQGGVASGFLSEAQARAISRRAIDLLDLPVAEAYLCPHMAHARVHAYALDCPNRKPKPGFLLKAMAKYDAAPEQCLFVGDSSTDEQAAQAASVPFQWADAFFGREIDRGLRDSKNRWVKVRQVKDQTSELALRAYMRKKIVGEIRLVFEQKNQHTSPVARVHLEVDDGPYQADVEHILLSTAQLWAAEGGIECQTYDSNTTNSPA